MEYGYQIRIIIALFYAVFAAIILYLAHWNKTRIKIGLLTLAIGIWLVGFDMLRISATMLSVQIWAKTLFIAAPFILMLFYFFSLDFLPKINKLQKIQNYLFPAIFLVIVSQFLFTENLLTKFNPAGSTLIEKASPGKWFPLCLVFYLYILANYISNLIIAYRTSDQKHRIQIGYVAFSTVVCLAVVIITAGVLPVFGIEKYIWLSPYSALLIALTMAYTVYKYRLLEFDLLMQKISAYLFIALMAGAVNIIAIYLSVRMFGADITRNHYLLMILMNIILALYIFSDVPRLEKIGGEYFTKQKEKHYKALERELRSCAIFISLTELVEFIAGLLEEKMQILDVVIYLKDKNRDSNYYRMVKRGTGRKACPEMLLKDNPLITYLKKNPDYLETGEFRHKYEHLYRNGRILDHEKYEVQTILEKSLSSAMVLPVVQNGDLGGIIVLGDKKSGFAYNTRDLHFLEKLVFDFGLTLENLKLKEQLVDKEKLIMIGTIAASLAHEIHNPLTSVKTLVEMLPTRTGHREFLESFMTIVPKDIDRVIAITRGLEAFALPTPSMPALVNIKFIVDEILALLQNQINSNQVEIVTEIDETAEITADAKKINQLFMNLILNACQASKARNKIIIKVRHGEVKDGVGVILAEIVDEGEGIKPEEMPNIFKPFYSTRIYGTGLGLPTCKRIIEDHKGEITVESHIERGTKVTIALPIDQ